MESSAAFLARMEKEVDAELQLGVRRMLAEPSTVIRRHPAIALGLSLAAGCVTTRLLRGGGRNVRRWLGASSASLLWALSAVTSMVRRAR